MTMLAMFDAPPPPPPPCGFNDSCSTDFTTILVGLGVSDVVATIISCGLVAVAIPFVTYCVYKIVIQGGDFSRH